MFQLLLIYLQTHILKTVRDNSNKKKKLEIK